MRSAEGTPLMQSTARFRIALYSQAGGLFVLWQGNEAPSDC